jgi:hypothetical protein
MVPGTCAKIYRSRNSPFNHGTHGLRTRARNKMPLTRGDTIAIQGYPPPGTAQAASWEAKTQRRKPHKTVSGTPRILSDFANILHVYIYYCIQSADAKAKRTETWSLLYSYTKIYQSPTGS